MNKNCAYEFSLFIHTAHTACTTKDTQSSLRRNNFSRRKKLFSAIVGYFTVLFGFLSEQKGDPCVRKRSRLQMPLMFIINRSARVGGDELSRAVFIVNVSAERNLLAEASSPTVANIRSSLVMAKKQSFALYSLDSKKHSEKLSSPDESRQMLCTK